MRSSSGLPRVDPAPRAARLSLTLLASLAAILAVAVWYFVDVVVAREREEVIGQWRDRLTAMADDRKAFVERWVAGRLEDAQIIASYPTVTELLARRPARPTSSFAEGGPEAHLGSILREFARLRGYQGIYVLDAEGRPVTRSEGSMLPEPGCLQAPRAVLDGRPSAALFHLHASGLPIVAFAAPLTARSHGRSTPSGRPRGAVLLEVDPAGWLYPVLATEPVPTSTGETLLLRREGEAVLFLSPLRHHPGKPLSFRQSPDLPGLAAQEALAGRAGFSTFVDYRGIPVYAAVRRIEGTAWGLVVKVDRDEVLASLEPRVRGMAVAGAAVVLALAGVGWGLWRGQRARYQVSLARSEARFGLLLDEANDAIFFAGRDGRVREANRRAQELYGYTREELRGMEVARLRAEELRATTMEQLEAVARAGNLIFETVNQRKDGSLFPAELSSRLVELGGEELFLSIVRDVSERRNTEERMAFLNRLLRAISDINELVIREKDRDRLLAETCRIAVERGQFRMAWIGFADRSTGIVRPAASAGHEDGYLSEITVRFDDTPQGRGPLGTAIREDRTEAIEDVEADERFAPWREVAARRGYRSVAAVPLRMAGSVLGAFAVYAGAPRVFCPEVIALLEELAGDLSFALDAIEADRRREGTERALADSEARFRSLIESAPVAISIVRSEKILYANPACARLFGYERLEDIEDRTFLSHIAPECRDELAERHRRRENGEAVPHMLETLGLRRDGSLVPLLAEVAGLELPDGFATLIFLLDMTELRRAEVELRRLATAIEQSAETVVITDAEGTIEYVNPAFERITGYSRAQALGQNPRLLKSGHHPPEFYRELWSTLRRGEAWSGHLVNKRRDGTLYEEEATISPVRDASGHIAHFVAVKRDVTERQQLEARLLQAQKMESVGRLAGGVAHDFNNLLSVILGYAELILRRLPEADPLRPKVAEIQKAGERAAALTSQLLAFSRRQVLRPVVMDLNATVENLEKMLRRLIGEDIDLSSLLDRRAGLIRADPGQIEQIIINLAVNSRDAMPRGGRLTIETAPAELDEAYVRMHPGAKAGPHVALIVSDNGSGMDAETQAHLFEPFFTTKEQGKGTGLGLATVYGIVEQSGGHIAFESQVDRGTAFRIHFPRVEGEASAAAGPAAAADEARGTETVLLVEDEEMLRELASQVLRLNGYQVLEAPDGADALRLLERRQEPVDLVVTDVVMPRMSGPELAHRLAAKRPGIKVLFLSGYAGSAIARHGLPEASSAFLAKPFTPDALARKVREVLDEPRGPRS